LVVDLVPIAVHYGFRQSFHVSARGAFEWCTDYSPADMGLLQQENATRQVQRLSNDVIILVDTYVVEGKSVVKQRLVCLYPKRLTWTATHLTGPNRYSQFLYEITPQGDQKCYLTFTGLQLYYNAKEDAGAKEIEALAKELEKTDSEIWKRLAKEMEKELIKR
jgi:hypothetical protein